MRCRTPAARSGGGPYDRRLPALSDFDGFALDLDGVVWLSREPVAGSIEAIRTIVARGLPVVYVTNDPRSTRTELAARLTELGIETPAEAVLTSASACAETLALERPGAAAMAVGTGSLARELADRGLAAVPIAYGARADAVVVGGGGNFDYEVLRIASDTVRAGAELWATNKDPNYPTPNGLVPGTGAIVAAIEVASGVSARDVGKPEPGLFEAALRHLGCERPLMVGDSLDSDIAGAARAGIATALVLTGRSSRADLDGAEIQPDHIYENLAAVAADL